MSRGISTFHVTVDASFADGLSDPSTSQPAESVTVCELDSPDKSNNTLGLGQLQFTFDVNRGLDDGDQMHLQGSEQTPHKSQFNENWSSEILLVTGPTDQATFDVTIQPNPSSNESDQPNPSSNESDPSPIIAPIPTSALDEKQRRCADFKTALTKSLTERIGEGNFKIWQRLDFGEETLFIMVGTCKIGIGLDQFQKNEDSIIYFKYKPIEDCGDSWFSRRMSAARAEVIDKIGEHAASAFRAKVSEEVLESLVIDKIGEHPASAFKVCEEVLESLRRIFRKLNSR